MADSITQAQLAQAISQQVANSSGESIGLKTLRRDLEAEFGLAKRALDPRKDEIKELLLAAMNQAEEPRGRARTGASTKGGGGGGAAPPSTRPAAETIMPWEEEPEELKGKERKGQKADFEGFLKKRGDQGRIKIWQKRFFRLYKDEGVIAYFKNDKETAQLGEISVVGAFLIEKRDDVAKLAFTITMKTTARIWWLQAKDEAQRQSWMDACAPLMKEDGGGGVEKKRKKPPLGEPLRYPPSYVQGWSDIELSKSVIQDSKNWTGLLPAAPPQVELEDGLVAVHLHGRGLIAVEEVREVKLQDGVGYIHNLPKQLKNTAQTVQWTAKDSQLTQHKFLYDNRTQEELLKRLVGHEIEVSNRADYRFGKEIKFKGKVAYHSEDRVGGEQTDLAQEQLGHQFALVDEGSNTVHFLNTKDAHSFNLLDVDRTKLSPGSDDVFAEPRLWAKFQASGDSTLGQLAYHVEDAMTFYTSYVLTLNANETVSELQGTFSVENKTSRTYENATLSVLPDPSEKPKRSKQEEEKSLEEKAEEIAKEEAEKEAKKKAPAGLGALAALAKKPEEAPKKPPPPRILRYPVAEKVTLPAYDWAHASFLHQAVSSRSQHLIRFDTPKYTVKPVTAQDHGVDAGAIAKTVVFFKNPLDTAVPGGRVRVNRRDASNHGVRHLVDTDFPRVEAGERVIIELEDIEGVSVTRKQTGFNFDAEKRFIIESFEIHVANSRQELIHLSIEESMYRWATYEITSTWPQYKTTPHPRVIRWVTSLNHGEDITIRYTVFYSSFELEDWLSDEEGEEPITT